MADEDKKSNKKSRKPSKKLLYFLIILIVVLAEGFILCYDYATNEESFLQEISDDYPILNEVLKYIPTNFADSDSTESSIQKSVKRIGKNSLGTVTVEGPYGNNESSVKVAYVLGQHPRESNAHDAIYNSLLNSSDYLNYSYYVYRINVTGESDNFEESRMNGQLLAQDFVVDDIVKSDTVAYESAKNITDIINYIIYYEPASYSSPQYSTIPMDEGGVPSIVFEMRGNPDYSLETEANQFIHAVDKLNI